MQAIRKRVIMIAIAALVAAAMCLIFAFALGGGAGKTAYGEKGAGVSGASAATSGDYEAKDFTATPSGFELISGSDTAHTSVAFFDGEMSIDHSGSVANASNYYGAAYGMAKDREWDDFEFEMTFRMVSEQDAGRFIAVMFRTKTLGQRTVGYMVNYRADGRNAMSALNATGANDKSNPKSVALTDRKLHTLRLELAGKQCKYYMDGVLLCDYDISEQDAHLGGEIESGGFALIVNRSRIMIDSVRIQKPDPDAPVPPVGAIRDDIIAETYYESAGLVNGPAVICDAVDAAALSSMTAAVETPSAVILRLNADCDVVGKNNEIIGEFDEVYKSIRGRIVPVVRVESVAAADAFIEYMTDVRNILDISVASSDPALVKRVRTAFPATRGAVFYDNIENAADTAAELNINRATVAIVPQRAATLENVTAIQARFKTVWVMPESYMFADIYDCVNSGAYGVVSPYYRDVYDAIKTYADGATARAPMNVAHRGCSNATYENSLSAVKLAVEKGATHLELDGKLTTDGHIVIMHDDSLTGTTTGAGNIESKTLAELMRYNLTLRDGTYLKDDNGDDIIEKIPTLEQVLDEIKDTDVILVFEIKTNKLAIVDKLKAVLDEYGMKDQVIAITFDDNGEMLDKMYSTLPEIPVAWLEGLGGSPLSVNEFGAILKKLGSGNAALDKSWSHGGSTLALNRFLRDRGMVGWYWTFANETAVKTGESMGYLGITNNCAEMYENRVRFVTGANQSKASLAIGDDVKVNVTTYAGVTTEKTGKVTYCRKTNGGWRVVASFESDCGKIYTQSFVIQKS